MAPEWMVASGANPLNEDDDTPVGQCDPLPSEPEHIGQTIVSLLVEYEAAKLAANAASDAAGKALEAADRSRERLRDASKDVRCGFFRLGLADGTLVRIGDRVYQFRTSKPGEQEMVEFSPVPFFQEADR